MASLSLRAYLQKIENLIERGETEEAIAHCKHILKKFPKYVDTYRLLGKSYLEMQRYQEASDVLQRVLSVIPDDFVSQIGMSIIREDSENLDEAIWHMERAFEIQPSNNAVQDELKRLYGRRDGVIPQKILLTRGALVRMYVRGEAYPQAIAEGIAALKEDPQRSDIQLLLAKSYLRTNQINEGYRICQKILEFLPYSYEANQLLAEIHILTKQSDQAEPYLEHVRMLDPYAAFVNENAPTSAKVNENAIIIDELDYDEMASALESAGSSNSSMYIDDDFDTSSLEIPTAGDSQPIEVDEDFSWMQDMVDNAEPEKSPNKQQASQEVKAEKEPDFPFDSTSDFDNISSEDLFSEDGTSDDDAFAALFAEINGSSTESDEMAADKQPEQSKDTDNEPMTMAEFFESTAVDVNKNDKDSDDNTLDDFAALFDEQISDDKQTSIPEISEVEPEIEDDAVRDDTSEDNFAAFFEEQVEISEKQPVIDENISKEDDQPVEVEDLPDWLKELDQESKDSNIEENLQNEIDSLFTNGDLATSESKPSDDGKASDRHLDDEEEFTAKFLQELENEPQHPGKTRMFSMTADLSSGDSGPLPPLSEDIAPAETGSEVEIPDWLKQLEDQTNEFSGSDESQAADIQDELPKTGPSSIDSMSEEEEDLLREQYKAAQQSTKTTQMLSEEEDDDDGFAWLESLAAKQNAGGEPVSADEIETDSPFAEEISQMQEDVEPEIKPASTSIDSMTEEEEDRLREQFKFSEQTSKATQMLSEDEDDSFAWLESLAAKQGSSQDSEQAEQIAADEVEEESVQGIASEPVSQKSATSIDSMTEEEEELLREQFKSSQQTSKAAPAAAEEDDDSFAWLESLAAKQGASEDTLLTSEEDRESEVPEWLQETASTEDIDSPIFAPEHTAILGELNDYGESIEEEPVTISKLEQTEIPEEIESESKIEEPVWVDEFAVSEAETNKETQILSPDSAEAELLQNLREGDVIIPIIEDEIEDFSVEDVSSQKIIDTPQTPDDIPDWLKDLEDKTSIYAITDKDDSGQSINGIEDVEIPGWITDVNETQQIDLDDNEEDLFEGVSDDIPEVHTEYISDEEIEEEEQSADAFKAIGLDITELEKQLEQEQIIEHIDGKNDSTPIEEPSIQAEEPEPEEIPSPINEIAPKISEEEPSQPEEELVFDIPSDLVDEILQETEPTSPILQINDDDTQLLSEIGKLISENKISDALTKADQLIEKEIYLENIIEELNQAIVDHPLDPSIYVRLGDAYIRNNEIQKALDMYQEAETLLQK